MDTAKLAESSRDLEVHRRLLALAGVFYLLWWFAVEIFLPGAFNPFLSRLCVVILVLLPLFLSYFSVLIRLKLRSFFVAATWLITLHYYYLFYFNAGDSNWIVGCYVTVFAIDLLLFSTSALLFFSIFVTALSVGLVILLPPLRHSVFLPGLITILIQANIGLRSRLSLLQILRDSNERFSLLFNSTFEGIFVHEAGRITQINDSLAQLMGFSRPELIGSEMFSIFHPRERTEVLQKIDAAPTVVFETVGIRKDGTSIDLEVCSKEFKSAGSPARLVTVQDLADRKRAEKDRVAALTLAENVRLRDEFISLASHELKTPICGLKLQAQMIEHDLKQDPSLAFTTARLGEFVHLFNRQIARLIELVETMLDVSRISSGRLSLDLQNADFAELVRETVTALPPIIRSNSTQIHLEGLSHLPVRMDSSRVRQVVENLLSNALKYGDEKPIRIAVQLENSSAILIVEDQGQGIPQDAFERIFNRFERAVSGRHIAGLGLGLYIARQIAEAHNGKITVESKIGVGSTFKFTFPTG